MMPHPIPDWGRKLAPWHGIPYPENLTSTPGCDTVVGMSTHNAEAQAALWLTDNVANLFVAEINNERDGGVSPATLDSTIDSIAQAPDIMCEGWSTDDFVSLLMIVSLLGLFCEVADILRARA